MDDETAKKVEKDWIANQPFEKLADPSKDGVPQGFARFSWLRSNDVAQYWWVYPSVVVGVVVFSLGTPLLTEGWMDHNSILFRLLFGFMVLLGAFIGFYVGWRLNRRKLMDGLRRRGR